MVIFPLRALPLEKHVARLFARQDACVDIERRVDRNGVGVEAEVGGLNARVQDEGIAESHRDDTEMSQLEGHRGDSPRLGVQREVGRR